MRYTKTNTKKPYTSPELSIHELRFEGVMEGMVSGKGHDQDHEGEWFVPAPKFMRLVDDDDYLADDAYE